MNFIQIMCLGLTVFVSDIARAGTISCAGDHLGYQFAASAKAQNNRVVGNIHVNISQGGRSVKRTTLTPTSSDIREGQYLRFAATGADGSGNLNASYTGGGYSGSLIARTNWGTFNVSVNCRLSGSDLQDYEIESALVQ